jgi:hypothetical protein
MEIPIQVILSLLSIGISIVVAYYGFVVKISSRTTKLETENKDIFDKLKVVDEKTKCLIEIEKNVTELKTRIDIFWKVLEPHLATIIHSPQHVLRDNLIDKMISSNIQLNELKTLINLLREALKEEQFNPDKGKRFAFAFLLARSCELTFMLEKREDINDFINSCT